MDEDTKHILGAVDLLALPKFIQAVLKANEDRPHDLFKAAVDYAESDPQRYLTILIGLLEHSQPNEHLVDAVADVLVSEGKIVNSKEALADMSVALMNAGPKESDLRTRVVAKLFSAGAEDDVVSFAKGGIGRADQSRYWYLALRSAEKCDDKEAVLSFAAEMSQTNNVDPSHLLNAGVSLLKFGQAQRVLDMIARNPHAANSPNIVRLKLDAELRLGLTSEQSLERLQVAVKANPTDVNLVNLEAQLYLTLDRPKEALAAYDRLPQDRTNNTMKLRYANAQVLAGELDKAIETYRRVLMAMPTDKALRRKLVGLYVRAGKKELARTLYSEGLESWTSNLAPSVRENVARIMSSDNSNAIPRERAMWFEQALKDIDRPPASDWRLHAGEMARLDQFIVEYAQIHPDGVDQLGELVEVTKPALNELDKGLELGKGAFVASAHIGLLYAGPIVLNKYGSPYSYVASVPDLDQPGISNGLISTSTNDVGTVGRRILKSLRANETVAIAIDGAGTPSTEMRTLFGKKIRLSDFVPRVAGRTGTPSYFPRITLVEGRAQFGLVQLPLRNADEDEENYVSRWLDAYALEIQKFLTEHPEAMRGTGGLWNRIIDA